MITITLCTTAKVTLMYGTILWTLWERERVGRFGRMTLKHVKYFSLLVIQNHLFYMLSDRNPYYNEYHFPQIHYTYLLLLYPETVSSPLFIHLYTDRMIAKENRYDNLSFLPG